MFRSTMWGGDQRGGRMRRLPHAVVIDRRQNSHKASLVSILSFVLVVVVMMYLVVIWSFHSSLKGGKEQNTEQQHQQQQPERIQLQKNGKQHGYCDFRAYPDHRYYGIPEFHGTGNGNHLPDFLNTEYIYGQLPQMIQPKESAVKQKLCVDQSEWYKPEPILENDGKGKTRLPFADGTNPSILRLKDNTRIDDRIRKIFTSTGNGGDEDDIPVYLTTICMTNSQCGWKDTEQHIIDYRLSTQEKPSTVRTVLLVLNKYFETLLETTIYTEIDAKFGNRIKGPQHVGGSGRSRAEYKKKTFALDDARLFTYRGDVWLSYREGKGFGYDKQVLNKVHFDLQNNGGTSTFEVTLKASETETLCCGRNMALLDNVQTNNLQALTWVDPVTVVDVELTKNSNLPGRRLSETNGGKKKQNKQKKSHFHGTNGFMLYLPKTDEYLGIGHFHRPPDREKNEYARFGHHYTHAFFTIPARPPFYLKRLSPELVLPSHAKYDDAEIIQFWSGLELHDDDTIVIAYGINDCEGAATYLDLSTVESLLRDVSAGKEVVDLMMPLTP